MAVTRNHTGHRCGASHQRAKVGDEVVVAARQLRERGKTVGQIAASLRYRHGVTVSQWTIRDWVDMRTRTDV